MSTSIKKRLENERRGPESNRRTRICSPLRSHSATAPKSKRLAGYSKEGLSVQLQKVL